MKSSLPRKTRRRFLRQCGENLVAVSSLGWLAQAGLADTIIAPKLRAGVAQTPVTPPVSMPYLASSDQGTGALFQGIHCDLWAKALVFDDGKKSLALLSVDAIGYDNMILGQGRNFTQELRRKIAAKTTLRPEAIMLAATHAHSTPETIGLTSFRDMDGRQAWLENHLEMLVETAVAAWQKREAVFSFFGSQKVEGIARHRRIVLHDGTLHRYGPLPKPEKIAQPWELDENLSVLYFRKVDGSPHSVLLNYTAHPVVAMLLPKVCADYPGAAAAFVEKELPGAVCLFTQGAAGNINSVYVSTNYDDVEKLGQKLGEAAVRTVAQCKTNGLLRNPALHFAKAEVPLAARACPSLAEAERTMWDKPDAANQRIFRLAKKLAEDDLRAEVQAMGIGPVQWISLPGEPFVETGLALKQAGASFVIGYANGWHGYFPIRRAYDEGGYEVKAGAWSRVAAGSAEQLEKAGKALLRKNVAG